MFIKISKNFIMKYVIQDDIRNDTCLKLGSVLLIFILKLKKCQVQIQYEIRHNLYIKLHNIKLISSSQLSILFLMEYLRRDYFLFSILPPSYKHISISIYKYHKISQEKNFILFKIFSKIIAVKKIIVEKANGKLVSLRFSFKILFQRHKRTIIFRFRRRELIFYVPPVVL